MSETARERVLSHLRAALAQRSGGEPPPPPPMPDLQLSPEERVARLRRLMTNMHAQIHETTADGWVDTLKALARERSFNHLLYAPATAIGQALDAAWESDLPPLAPYTDEIEQFKERLFATDAAITSTVGGIAESGALILWPSAAEPRLMSLVPTVHIAVLDAAKIHATLAEAMAAERWQDRMPTNVLLISGPSKTADIELTLTFGVHGPKELIVLLRH